VRILQAQLQGFDPLLITPQLGVRYEKQSILIVGRCRLARVPLLIPLVVGTIGNLEATKVGNILAQSEVPAHVLVRDPVLGFRV